MRRKRRSAKRLREGGERGNGEALREKEGETERRERKRDGRENSTAGLLTRSTKSQTQWRKMEFWDGVRVKKCMWRQRGMVRWKE